MNNNFEDVYDDLEELTINDLKSRLLAMGADLDFEKHPKKYYKDIYVQLLADPTRRQFLRRNGIIRKQEGTESEKQVGRKRPRGI
jgi:hypothetical protein